MRILLLSQWFDPEPTFKGLAFARALVHRGHQVDVLTGFPNYPGGKLYRGYKLGLWRRESVDGVHVLRVALYPSHDRSAAKRAANYFSFAFAAAVLGVPRLPRPDVAYVYHPPATIGIPALALRSLRGVPFVLDIQDLWPDTLAATGMVQNRRLLDTVGAFCKLTYRMAARIAVLSPGFKRVLIDRGVPADKIDVIYNWCNEDAFKHTRSDAPILREAGINGRFSIVFAGTMGRAQSLVPVLLAAKLLEEKAPQVQFVFVGGGVEAASLKNEAAARSLRNVKFLPFRPAIDVMPLLAAADVLLVHLRDDPLFAITIPSKTQTYMAAGRPVLMAVRGDAANLILNAGAGLACTPESPEEICAAIERLYHASPEALRAMGERGRAYYRRELSFNVGVACFEQSLRKAAGVLNAETERSGSGGTCR